MNGASTRAVAAAGALLFLAGCGRGAVDPCAPPPGFAPPTPETVIAVWPTTLSLAPGERGTITALLTGVGDLTCRHLPLTIGWRSTNGSVARIEADTGDAITVLGVGPGTASVMARVIADSARRAATTVTVSPGS